MEEYLDGLEVSTESFTFAGRTVVLTLTDKLVGKNFIEASHAMPARWYEETTAQVVDLVGRFLDAVGPADGPSHGAGRQGLADQAVRRGGDEVEVVAHDPPLAHAFLGQPAPWPPVGVLVGVAGDGRHRTAHH